MDLKKAGALANIGSFILGFILLCLGWEYLHSPTAATATREAFSATISNVMMIFALCLVVAGLLQVVAAAIRLRALKRKSRVRPSASLPPSPQRTRSSPPPVPAPVLATPSPKAGERIFVGSDVTPHTLAALFQRNPDAQAKALLRIYIGKWIEVAGLVSDIDLSDGPQWLSLIILKRGMEASPAVSLHFTHAWRDRLSVLAPGHEVRAHGKISRIGPSYLELTDCELAPVEAASPVLSELDA